MSVSNPNFVDVDREVISAILTIPVDESVTEGINLKSHSVCGLIMPDAWTAADITFLLSYDKGVTYLPVYDTQSNEYTVQVDTSRIITIPVSQFVGVKYLKIQSGTSASPVTQDAERQITLLFREL